MFRPDSENGVQVQGAREHNLKDVSLCIPRDAFVVITGVSGSGKSTLAFDVLFAEGQRRFLDSMSAYARQFVEQMARPDVDLITGLPPTVSIEQRTSRGGGKSTVSTVTEIYHFVRLLFAKLGTPFCPDCELPVQGQTRDEVGRRLLAEAKRRGNLTLLAPVVRNRKGFHSDVAEWAAKHGYAEVRADGRIFRTSEPFRLDRFREHDIEIVVGILDRSARSSRLQPLVDQSIELGKGTLFALDGSGNVSIHSTERSCPKCGRSLQQLDPKMFSYNSAQGWCPRCRGFGELFYLPEVDRRERADAIEETWFNWMEGERETCPDCRGTRLNPVARAVRLVSAADRLRHLPAAPTIVDVSELSVESACEAFAGARFRGREALIARDILPEIRERLQFLNEVGLGYLQLGRGVTTLSGGEAQRIRLAAQLGSNLSGVLYVLDEPTIGLHARDNDRLLATLAKLRARGNSVVVVEHDEETMRRADYVLDLGPGGGMHGGNVVAAGRLRDLIAHDSSVTGRCLREKRCYPITGERRPVSISNGKHDGRGRRLPAGHATLTLRSASLHNLKDLTVSIPLHRLVMITGVSGSGKSSLVNGCLFPALEQAARRGRQHRGDVRVGIPGSGTVTLSGADTVRAVYEVNQSPIGRTPRSIPATYVGFFDEIRRLFAQTPEARLRGYSPSRFSFNSAQGRCPECDGAGTIKLEMNFLPPAYVPCETCSGTRFNLETLDIEYASKNIAQVLEMSVEEAREFFSSIPKIRRPLEALCDTGVGYLKLGQTSPTLSGGEAQRVKLVTHLLSGLKEQLTLFDPKEKKNVFILEEPTIGLHMADVRLLADVLQRLVNAGHTVIVIEHNLDLIAEADWIIDLGPEGGDEGGTVVVAGTPEDVARDRRSHTGRFLRPVLAKAKKRP